MDKGDLHFCKYGGNDRRFLEIASRLHSLSEFTFVRVRVGREITHLKQREDNSLEERTRLVQALFQRFVIMRAKLAGVADVLSNGIEHNTLEVHSSLSGLHVRDEGSYPYLANNLSSVQSKRVYLHSILLCFHSICCSRQIIVRDLKAIP